MTPKALAQLHAACFTTPRPWAADEFAALLATPGILLLTADDGFLLGRVAAGEAELLTLAIDPALHRPFFCFCFCKPFFIKLRLGWECSNHFMFNL